MRIDKNKLDRSSFKLFATGLNHGKVNDMATIKIRNNPYASYEYLSLAVNDVSVEGIIDVTGGPYVFHSVEEDLDVADKNITVSMVDPGTGNTLQADHSIASISGSTATGSIRFELGNQIDIKGASAGFVVDRASATVLLFCITANSNFKGAVLSLDLDSPQFNLSDASLTIGMGDDQHRDYFLVGTDIFRHVTDTGALLLADGTIPTITNSTLTTDYLYQGSTNRIVATDSRIDVTGGGIGSISANGHIYYRYSDGDNDHSGYYAWKENFADTIYTMTLEVLKSQTHYYMFDGDTPEDQGVISDCALPNTYENVASKGGIRLNNSTMTADVVRNMSTVSGDLGGIVLNNSTLTVAAFIENSGTIEATNGSTVNVTGSVFNDNASISVTGSTFTAAAVSLDSGSTFTVAGTSELHIGDLSGTIETDSEALTTLNASGITNGTIYAQNHLVFTGANTLKGITLNATGKTVSVGTGNTDSLTVAGNSTLNIGNLSGTITTAVNTGLYNSSITGGSITTSGSIGIYDSTLTSNTFDATAAGVSFSGTNTLNGVKLDAVGKYVWNEGTLTLKGENELHIGNLYGDGIQLDGATIKNSSITGAVSGGTLLVEEGKSATFSSTGSSINSLTHTSINNSGTINVNGTLIAGTITNTSGTITLNDGAKLTSDITGGSITTSNSGTVTVKYSTISSSAFTATAGEVIFSDENTLSGITLNATAENTTVKASGTLTVEGTNTLKIRTLDGTIKTAAGATLTGSTITGGGTNGGKIIALGTLTFDDNTLLRNITLDAHDQTVDTTYDLWLGGTITLDIDTLINKILVDEPTTFVNSTISKGNSSSQIYIYGSNAAVPVTFAGRNTIFDAGAGATGTLENYGTITVESRNNVKGELSACRVVNRRSITVGSSTDACSLSVTDLTNNKTVSVTGIAGTGEEPSVLSSLSASGEIVNNEKMTLTYSEVSAARLINTAPGIFGQGQSEPGLAISNSIASIVTAGGTGLLRNGADNNTSATTDISNSTVTADSVTNYGTHNGTDGNTGRVGFAMTDSTFTVNGTFTNTGWIYVVNSSLSAGSLVNSGSRFFIDGAGTLDIGSLEGSISITGTGTRDYEQATLNASHITGISPLGSTVAVSKRLEFTGENTLTNVTLSAYDKEIIIGNSASLTVMGTNTLNIGTVVSKNTTDIHTLSGTIKLAKLIESEAVVDPTLKSSHVNGGELLLTADTLTFTGSNTLTDVTLTAANKTVTVGTGNSDSLTAMGTNTLNIGMLNGTIKLAKLVKPEEDVDPTLESSHINGGELVVTADALTFAQNNTLNGVTLTATGKTITNTGTLTVNALSTITASAVSGGVLNVTTDGLGTTLTDDLYIVVNGTITGVSELRLNTSTVLTPGSDAFIDVGETGYQITTLGGKGVFLLKKGAPSTLYVSNAYPTDAWSVTDDGHLVGYNAFSSVDAATAAAQESGSPINLENGTYTEITQLRGAKTVIQEGPGTTEFTRAVYGGAKLAAAGTGTATRNTDITIETGTFNKFFVGGNNIAMPTTETTYTVEGGTQSVTISGGVFTAIVATADRVQKGAFTLNSDLEMNISGGQFDYFVAGGLLNSLYENTGEVEKTNGTADIYGNVSLNITGGIFADDCWIYGGCISTSRSVSSYASTIHGDVTVTIDCTAGNTIQLSHLTAGSHGLGQILKDSTSGGNTAIVFKGNGTNLSFTANGELWGGSGRDNVNARTGICEDSFVELDRLLSFEGFTGDLNCKKIRDFKSIRLVDESHVNMTESTVDLKGIENWAFEYDSRLSGNFGNDFAGDTLKLTGFDTMSLTDWTILTNGSDTAFGGFGSFSSVSFGTGEGSAASYSSGSGVWYNADYVLYRSENSMLLTTSASYVTRFGTIA